jgi:protein-S-isoprenylcysteine O-methyltransferase Ste14
VGMMAGLKFYVFLNSNLLTQIKASTINLSGTYYNIINEVIILVGVISGLIYFFFSKEHTGVVGKVSRIGIYFLMIKFGASFGFAVMGRISLLIGRFEELIEFSKPEYYYSTPVILVVIIIILGYWAFKENNQAIE